MPEPTSWISPIVPVPKRNGANDIRISKMLSMIFCLFFLLIDYVCVLALHVHADGTYKVIWQGHTLLIAGTTDQALISFKRGK